MFPPTLSSQSDRTSSYPTRKEPFHNRSKPFLFLLILISLGFAISPYGSLTIYPYFVLATIPIPPQSQQLNSTLNLRTACHGMDIQRIYVSQHSRKEISDFYTKYVYSSGSWNLTQEYALDNGELWWQSRRMISGWDASNRLMFFNLFFISSTGSLQDILDTQANQALQQGQTVYMLRINYVDDIQRNRFAVRDPKSECFLD